MFKRFVLAGLLLPLVWISWGTQRFDPQHYDDRLQVEDIARSVSTDDRAALGPFAFGGMWRLTGADRRFGGFSALVPHGDGAGLRAISDRNRSLLIDLPVRTGGQAAALPWMLARRWGGRSHFGFDIESAVLDPDTGSLWLGLEAESHVGRADLGHAETHHANRPAQARFFEVPELRDWPHNGGAEAMARLNDGRWIMLCEACGGGRGGLHLGLIFAGHPGQTKALKFGLMVPAGFDPVDAATLPDGRVLILVRRLALFPLHFEARIVLADFAALNPKRPLPTQELARLDGGTIRENWEGMALLRGEEPQEFALWLISDANDSAFQETRLLQLRIDPQRLPR